MSPVSRGRKGPRSHRAHGVRVVRAVPAYRPEPCDCPACTGGEAGLGGLLEQARTAVGDLHTIDDPIDAELLAAMLLSVGEMSGEEVADEAVPRLTEAGDAGALGLLLAFDTLRGSPRVAQAARQLVAAGVPEPAWAAAAREPLTGGLFRAYRYEDGVASMLACSFERAGRVHGFTMRINDVDEHAAIDIALMPGSILDAFLAGAPEHAEREGLRMVVEDLTPAGLRWEAERALDVRADHDSYESELPPDDDEDGPDYYTLAALLRSRVRTLPLDQPNA
jgi:hypothetical protein